MSGRSVLNVPNLQLNRPITKSEIQKGYFFITMDKNLPRVLNNSFQVEFLGETLVNRHVDASGRTYIGKKILRRCNPRDIVTIRIVSPNLISVKKY